ncbi:MAG: S-layer homology domain-containing protein, partial [Actinomycetota bacterium]
MHRALVAAAVMVAMLAAVPSSPVGAAAGFGDVDAGAFYARPVQWMADNEITTGTSPGCFSPDRDVTRAEVAVFIHRFAGEPAGGTEPFTDVATGQYYTEAVAWMVREGITTGTSPTTFSPGRAVTRGELATFLWRFMSEPAGGTEPFADVTPDRFFADAVAWMVSDGITNGTSPTTFSPGRAVTRGEVATFVYRVAGEPPVDLSLDGTCGSAGGGPGGDEPPSGSGGFETLPLGAQLPSGAECATRVRAAAETRPGNAGPNATRGFAPHPTMPRVDGDFTGTTDEILQWAACKWGIDEDIVRAQTVKESYWHMGARGDRTGAFACHPDLVGDIDETGHCPESVGILQVRYPFHPDAFSSAIYSTAYNADYTYAVWRACYEGEYGWLGGNYTAGEVEAKLFDLYLRMYRKVIKEEEVVRTWVDPGHKTGTGANAAAEG